MLALLAALGCVVANGFFVAAEFALAKVRPTALEALAKQGSGPARRAHAITQRLDAYLSATQLGITLASLALGWLGEPAMERLLSPVLVWVGLDHSTAETVAVAVGFAILSALHIVIGELVPKSLAILKPVEVSILSAGALRAFYYVFFPALWVLNGTSNLVLRALRLPAPEHAEGKLSAQELRLVIQASLDETDRKKRDLVERALRATDRPVRSVMVPRVDMEVLSLRDDYATLTAKVRKFGFSRWPISETGDADGVIGYVYVKDLLMAGPDRARAGIATLRRDILIVPEHATVGDVLEELQESSIPIALVVDEYGGTAGLVTLEDIVVEFLGQVRDEITRAITPAVERAGDGSLVVHGATPLDEFELDGVRFDDVGTGATVSRYVLDRLGRLASPGDVLDLGGWQAVVEDVRARRVHRVRFRRTPPRDSVPVTATGL
jgi:CBS domain containing-hemolysin-like protein